MNPRDCNRVRTRVVGVGLGLADEFERRSLVAHLERCAACRGIAAEETALSLALGALRAEVAPPLDVTGRVMRGIRGVRRPGAREVSGRQLVWSGAAAIAAIALASGSLLRQLPQVLDGAHDLWTLLSSTGAAGIRLNAALLRLISAAVSRLVQLGSHVVGQTGFADGLATTLAIAVAVSYLLMGVFVLRTLARELVAARPLARGVDR